MTNLTNEEIDIYERVTNLFIEQKRSASEIEGILLEEGIDRETAQAAINEVSNRIRTLKLQRTNSAILRGVLFIVLGLIFCGIRANAVSKGEISGYGGFVDYIGLIPIVYGLYKIIKSYRERLHLKRDDFNRSM